MSLYPNSDYGGKRYPTGRKKGKNYNQKKNQYGYIVSMFPKESQKYADDIQYSTMKLYKSLKKNVMNKYY
tara:strand:+ start:1894 stop:2103 length:210 start_codon:yes stop_codon:yes gene_type:complete